MVFNNEEATRTVNQASAAVKQLANPTEAGLRASMADIKAQVEVVTHRLKYNLEMRNLLLAEHRALERQVNSRSG